MASMINGWDSLILPMHAVACLTNPLPCPTRSVSYETRKAYRRAIGLADALPGSDEWLLPQRQPARGSPRRSILARRPTSLKRIPALVRPGDSLWHKESLRHFRLLTPGE